jgi:hypothetical protein
MNQAGYFFQIYSGKGWEGIMIPMVDRAGSIEESHKSDNILSGNLMRVCMGKILKGVSLLHFSICNILNS